MSDRPPNDDDDPLEELRAWFTEAATRERVVRGPERRRVQERRGLWFTARRASDVELAHSIRAHLNEYLRGLSRQELLRWIDGLWLGRLSMIELAVLAECATGKFDEPYQSPRRRRRTAERTICVRGARTHRRIDRDRRTERSRA